MARPRGNLIDLTITPYYHCISRCVRRAFLCGQDTVSKACFNHRRRWLVERFKLLSTVFSIDICAYAVMSNHYHLVLRVDRDKAIKWSDEEVVKRWYQLCHGHLIVDRYKTGQLTSDAEKESAKKIIDTWRHRLYDISWYMRLLNEYIARQANKEDECTGRFWEGRFQSQALLDETAILSCMAYVDLNPIRAGIAKDLSSSDFSAIQERIRAVQGFNTTKNTKTEVTKPEGDKSKVTVSHNQEEKYLCQPGMLLPFGKTDDKNSIPYLLSDYLELLDWTGRQIHPQKVGYISPAVPKILNQLGIDQDNWLEYAQNFRRMFSNFAGRPNSLYQCAQSHHHRWYKGVG